MKDNYGFTLIELLAIVVILGVIIAVAAPNMTKQINKKEKTDQTILDEKISNAAHMYIAKYYSDKVVDDACNINNINNINPCSFTLNDLEQDGLINLKDKCTYVDDTGVHHVIDGKIYLLGNSYHFENIQAPDCASGKIK